MPPRVVELLASWRGRFRSLKVGSSMLNVVYLERENARSFEDCERSVLELKTIMLISLNVLAAAVHNSPHFSNFLKFMDLCFYFSLIGGLSCILLVYFDCALLGVSLEFLC
jgi:hypothetical protein